MKTQEKEAREFIKDYGGWIALILAFIILYLLARIYTTF